MGIESDGPMTAAEKHWYDLYRAKTAENERLRAALDEYQCPGLASCPVQKLRDSSCINAGIGHCGDTAFRALHQQQITNRERSDEIRD